jgi:DNA-binding transcriptional MocR family regulator
MAIWPPDRESLTRPVYHSLAQCLVRALEAGEIKSGTKLPTHRALAFELEISVQTVSRAYEELARLGVISGHVGRGSYVLSNPTEAQLPWQRPADHEDVIDLSMLVPVFDEIHASHIAHSLKEMGENLPYDAVFSFRPRKALIGHSAHARNWLVKCGVQVDGRDGILPTNGNTSAMTCALMTAAMPGDVVVAEEMGHHTMVSLTSILGLKLSGLAMDAEGILPEAFERACVNGPVKVLSVLPAGLGPTAAVMGMERRKALVAPIVTLAPERTFYFTGMSKCILPGLRIAWLVIPQSKVHAARSRHLVTNWMATPLIAEIASRWIKDGTANELLEWQRTQLGRRNQIAAKILQDIPYSASQNGMHVWLPLPDRWREDDFVALARHDGVAVAAGSNFAAEGLSIPPGVRVCLGAGSEGELEEGLKILVRLLQAAPEKALLTI